MEKKKTELDPVSERLMAFVNEQGGPSPVAAQLDKHPQIFYNIREGKSKPSMDTLREIKLAYPDSFDLDWVIMGVSTTRPPLTPFAVDMAVIQAKDQLIEMQKQELIKLQDQHAELLRSYLKLAEKGFNSSNSQFTADPTQQALGQYVSAGIRSIGFDIPVVDKDAPKVGSPINMAGALGLIQENGRLCVPRPLATAKK